MKTILKKQFVKNYTGHAIINTYDNLEFIELKEGFYNIEIKKSRLPKIHRTFFFILTWLIDNSESFIYQWLKNHGYQERSYYQKLHALKDKYEAFRWFLKYEYLPHEIKTNFVTGQYFEDATSMAFDSLDQVEFEKFFKKFENDIQLILECSINDILENLKNNI